MSASTPGALITQAQTQTKLESCLERLRRALSNPWLQRAALVAVIVWVFWNGLWAGVARSDQVLYLYRVSEFDTLWDILSRAPSWNRLYQTAGDQVLYRPVLYLQLGSFYYLFRYNFIAWQVASLCLHTLVVLGIHLLLIQGRLNRTLYPLLISLWFGTAFFASEMVFWNHIVGYLLFCGLEVYAVYFFLRFLQSDRATFLVPCALLSVTAEFTYETGALVNLLFAATLLASRLSAPAATASSAQSRGSAHWRLALGFVLAALLLPIASLIDLRIRGFAFLPNAHGVGLWPLVVIAVRYAFAQIGFWTSAWLAPTVYQVVAAGRAICEVSSLGLTGLRLLNLIALALLTIAGVLGLNHWLRRSAVSKREPLFALSLCLLFLFGYSIIIATGRSMRWGLPYILYAHIYYSYVAYLTLCVGIALAAFAGRTPVVAATTDAESEPDTTGRSSNPPQSGHLSRVGRRFAPALAILAFVNACGVHELARAFRYVYAPPRQELVDLLLTWQKQVGENPQRYFVVSPTCHGNDMLWWFDATQLRKNFSWRPPVNLADALWPDRSAGFNAERIGLSGARVDEIVCPETTSSAQPR